MREGRISAMENPDDITTQPSRDDPAKKLGLSKVVYGLGMGERDALVASGISMAITFPIMLALQGKNAAVDAIAKVPVKLHEGWNKMFKGNSGKAGKALGASVGIATIVGYIAHAPGLIRGPKKIANVEDRFNAEVAENQRQAQEIQQLTDTVKRQGIELTEARAQLDPRAAQAEHGDLAEKYAAKPAASKGEAILSQRAASAANSAAERA